MDSHRLEASPTFGHLVLATAAAALFELAADERGDLVPFAMVLQVVPQGRTAGRPAIPAAARVIGWSAPPEDVAPLGQTTRMSLTVPITAAELAERAEARRVEASAALEAESRATLGQFLTPAPIAALLASMFEPPVGPIRVLDAGAGVGSLTASLVARALKEHWPVTIEAHAVEVDEDLVPALKATLQECELAVPGSRAVLHTVDFIEWASDQLGLGLFAQVPQQFDVAILNPPYRKFTSASRERQFLSGVGIETSNLYSAFAALCVRLLAPGGQLVAIIPRSFCNGPYFKAFREQILSEAAIARIHLFEARNKAFRDTAVLQENVILHLVKGGFQGEVVVSSSDGSCGDTIISRSVPFEQVVHPGDRNRFIHVVTDASQSGVSVRLGRLSSALVNVDAEVSTGRVVDFRAREYLRMESEPGTVPLLYPMHLREGRVRWPGTSSKKACALVSNGTTAGLLLPRGHYVLVKRFSSKEERRRVVATVLEDEDLGADLVAIENHVNVFHHCNSGLDLYLAWGLATYLNSTVLDQFFRQFNGHTQVNATDLRSLRYPTGDQLARLGAAARATDRSQATIDSLLCRHVPILAEG